jgi:hypothetical protein
MKPFAELHASHDTDKAVASPNVRPLGMKRKCGGKGLHWCGACVCTAHRNCCNPGAVYMQFLEHIKLRTPPHPLHPPQLFVPRIIQNTQIRL